MDCTLGNVAHVAIVALDLRTYATRCPIFLMEKSKVPTPHMNIEYRPVSVIWVLGVAWMLSTVVEGHLAAAVPQIQKKNQSDANNNTARNTGQLMNASASGIAQCDSIPDSHRTNRQYIYNTCKYKSKHTHTHTNGIVSLSYCISLHIRIPFVVKPFAAAHMRFRHRVAIVEPRAKETNSFWSTH